MRYDVLNCLFANTNECNNLLTRIKLGEDKVNIQKEKT